MTPMALLLNLLWLLFGGVWMAVAWGVAAVIMAITIIGLPWARAAFNIGVYTLLPFGFKAVDRDEHLCMLSSAEKQSMDILVVVQSKIDLNRLAIDVVCACFLPVRFHPSPPPPPFVRSFHNLSSHIHELQQNPL